MRLSIDIFQQGPRDLGVTHPTHVPARERRSSREHSCKKGKSEGKSDDRRVPHRQRMA